MKTQLKLAWCSYDAARFACKRWHYSRSLPCSKTARIGVWENGKFIGAVVFAWGANLNLPREFGLKLVQCVELCRVALDTHEAPVSKIIAIAVKMLKRLCPGLRLIVSYADPAHGHIGTVYQASGWLYVGAKPGTSTIMVGNKRIHRRTLNSSRFGTSSVAWLRKHVDPNACAVPTPPKFKYLWPLDDEIRKQLLPLSKPYPKRAASDTSDTPAVQAGEAGAAPSAALQPLKF